MDPIMIEQQSMAIIESELHTPLPEEIKPVVMRVIHATADFSFADTLTFSPGVVPSIRALLAKGTTVITDTNMALAGINKAALQHTCSTALCYMADEDVAAEARTRGETRASISMERALSLSGPRLLVCGNAPTFLFPLLERIESGDLIPDDLAVIGVPVGFVNVVEAKERLLASGLPCIVSRGRRGGSTVAAAIVNALLYGMPGGRV